MPHPWGTKRPSLEQHYYEIYNLPHVDLINVGEDPIEEITETGIRTKSGHFAEVDVIALATGFDSVTGSLAQLDIRGTNNESIADHWKQGLKTSMGIALHGFPNMFFLYGPQAPTAFSNGPSCVQIQARWVAKAMAEIKDKGITRFEAKEDMEVEWTRLTHEAWDASLFPMAKSWYCGANIPGRKVEPLNWYVLEMADHACAMADLNFVPGPVVSPSTLPPSIRAWRTASRGGSPRRLERRRSLAMNYRVGFHVS